jgi:hypothetical protein
MLFHTLSKHGPTKSHHTKTQPNPQQKNITRRTPEISVFPRKSASKKLSGQKSREITRKRKKIDKNHQNRQKAPKITQKRGKKAIFRPGFC